jgi:hypothetical protein
MNQQSRFSYFYIEAEEVLTHHASYNIILYQSAAYHLSADISGSCLLCPTHLMSHNDRSTAVSFKTTISTPDDDHVGGNM